MNTHTKQQSHRAKRRTPMALAALAGTAVAATAAIGMIASPAHADAPSDDIHHPGAPVRPSMPQILPSSEGQVRATAGVNVRSAPTTQAGLTSGMIPAGKNAIATCKLPGGAVDGNRTWYRLPGEGNEYVTGRYLTEVHKVPNCVGGDGPTAVFVQKRTWTFRGPSTHEHATLPALQPGTRMHVTCYVDAEKVGGKTAWYLVDNDEWLPANGIDLSSADPQYCN